MSSNISDSITRNFSIMFAAQAINWVSSFVLLMFLPRYLGNEDYGRLYLALSIKMMLSLFIDFGGNFLIPKEVARSEKEGSKILSSYIILRVLLWILSIGIIILLSNMLGYSEHVYLLILILAIGKLWEGSSAALKAYFQGIERTEYPSIAKVAERMFVAVFAVIALLLGADSIEIAIIISVGALINLLIVIWFSRSFLTLKYRFDSKVFKLLSSGLPYFMYSLFSVIYYRVDAIMLGAMTSEAVTGWYGGAYRFFDAIMVLPIIYKTAIFPIFSKLWNDKEGVLELTVAKSLKLLIILAIPVSISIFLFSEHIIEFFMGLEEYGPSVIILQIFAVSIPIIYIDFVLGSAILGAANKQKIWAVIGFVAIFINIAANYYMIPYAQVIYSNGGIGAGVATFITEFFIMVAAFWILPKSYFLKFKPSYFYKPLGAGVVMTAFVWLLLTAGLYWILTAVLGVAVYLSGLYVLKAFSEKEIEMIKNTSSLSRIKKKMFSSNNANI